MKILNILAVALLFLVSCSNQEKIFEQHRTFKNNTWHRFDKLEFKIPVEKTGQMYDIIFSFNHTKDYQYDNIPIHVIINTPSGEKRINEFNLKVRDKEKGFVGKSYNNSIKMEKVLWGGFVFNKKGEASISIEQIIPKYDTPHIKSAGIVVRQTQE